MNELARLAEARYFSVRTFRKSGAAVDTPVWFAEVARQADVITFAVFSAGNAGKVKRLRVSDRAQVARCDIKGGLQGEWLDASARLVADDNAIQQALKALRRKYGWQMHLADIGARLTAKFNKRAYLHVTVASAADGSSV